MYTYTTIYIINTLSDNICIYLYPDPILKKLSILIRNEELKYRK